MKLQINLLDVCVSDFFRGSHNPVLCIPVDNTLTISGVLENLKQEIHMCGDHVAYHINTTKGINESAVYPLMDAAFEEYKAAQDNLDSIAFPDIEAIPEGENECCEDCMAFFEFEPVDE